MKGTCAYCGKEVDRMPSQARKSKTGKMFCNKSCAASYNNKLKANEKHPNYKDGKGSYRNKALREKEHRCELCGVDDLMVLEVHHRDRDRTNNNIENLQILCANCHLRQHRMAKMGLEALR